MTAEQYLVGFSVLAVLLACIGFVAVRLRRWLLPGWVAASARLAEIVLATSVLLVLSEVMGSIGLFRRGPMVFASLLAAALAARVLPDASSRPEPVTGPPASSRRQVALASAVAVFVVGVWTASIAGSFWHGMDNFDTLVYHGPISARFVQTGWVTRLQFTHYEPLFTFTPANSELLHGFLALPFHRDLVSPLVTLACAELVLLAAWCIGRRSGVGAVSVLGAGLVVTLPMLVLTQAGQALNDVVGLAFFCAAAAVIVLGDGGWRATLVAGLAAGLAAGTKPPFLVPVGVLFLLPWVWRRTRDALAPWPWAAGALVSGAFWYVRNLARTGTPLPWTRLPGLPHVTTAEMRDQGWSLAHYLGDGHLWRSNFLPSLRVYFGAAWPLVLSVPVFALVVLVLRGGARERVVAAMGLVAFVTYVFTPFSAGGPRGQGWMFFWDLRFVTPPLGLGFAMLPKLPALQAPRRQALLMGCLLALLGVTVTTRTGPWSVFPRVYHPNEVAAGVGVVVAVAAGVVAVVRRPATRVAIGVMAMDLALLSAVGYWLANRYAAGRYARGPFPVQGLKTEAVYAWAHGVHNTRIGVGGSLRAQYPLYGVDLSNVVQYVGHQGSHGNFSRVGTCREWVQRVNQGAYRYIVVGETPGIPAPEQLWLARQAGVSTVMDRGGVVVFHLLDPLSAVACGA